MDQNATLNAIIKDSWCIDKRKYDYLSDQNNARGKCRSIQLK
jgi:hypothetical protein